MTDHSCPQEPAVVAAMAGGIPESLREHIDGCAVCTEVWSIGRAFADAKQSMPAMSLPPADAIYWRAMAREALEAPRRRDQEELRAIARFHLGVGWAFVTAAAVLFFLQVLTGADWLPPTVVAPVVVALATVGSYVIARSDPVPSLFGR